MQKINENKTLTEVHLVKIHINLNKTVFQSLKLFNVKTEIMTESSFAHL